MSQTHLVTLAIWIITIRPSFWWMMAAWVVKMAWSALEPVWNTTFPVSVQVHHTKGHTKSFQHIFLEIKMLLLGLGYATILNEVLNCSV